MFNNNSTVNECNSSEVENSSLALITITSNKKTINDYNDEETTDGKFFSLTLTYSSLFVLEIIIMYDNDKIKLLTNIFLKCFEEQHILFMVK